ncbi:uncharacterized protein LOC142355564 [Convolutriloba macropyga]|uniref:uncharacterized protein LOC142355564 n=1 Tax=Convolutriloba macropyga TaxID=536237 RepID=UPI003F51D0B4
MGQLNSVERRLQKDETIKKRYQETIDTDNNAGYVRKVDQTELNETKDKLQWYLSHLPVINPHRPVKVRRVRNAAAKYQGLALNDKLLSGPDLLQSLIGTIYRFREHPIALSADIEALRVHTTSFWDASEEAMCIVGYLQDEATLKITYVTGKCRVSPIRHMTISKLELQAAV